MDGSLIIEMLSLAISMFVMQGGFGKVLLPFTE
jgi:hypothetical protein